MPLDFNTKKKTRSRPRPLLWFLGVAVISTFVPEMSLAQNEGPVTLRFEDGRGSLTGRLTAFRDNKWFIDSSVGWLVLPNEGITCVGAACPEGTTLNLANAKVALTSKDGSVTIDGDLIEIADNQYVLATAVGEQRIDVDMVDCAGAACGTTTTTVAAAPVAPPQPQQPEDNGVELSNGAITLVGELLDVRDGAFILKEVSLGDVRVSMADFTCTGAACP